MATAHCVECDEEVFVSGRIKLAQKVRCDHCGAALEIVGTSPLELDYANEEEEEDDEWDDDEWDEEEVGEGEIDDEPNELEEDDWADDELEDELEEPLVDKPK